MADLKKFESGYMLGSITSDTESTLPRYEHDCSECLFLGTIDVINEARDGYDRYDLWVHEQLLGDELILRYGVGPDYTSMRMQFARQIEERKWKLAVEIYDKWIRRDRLPRRTEATLAPQLRKSELSVVKREIRAAIEKIDMTSEERIMLLAEVIADW